MVVLQALVVVMLVTLLLAESSTLSNITAGGNTLQQVCTLIGAMILFFTGAVCLKQLPGLATAIAGSAHFYAGELANATMGRASRATGRAVNAARGTAGRVGAAAQARLTAGRTLPPPPAPLSVTANS